MWEDQISRPPNPVSIQRSAKGYNPNMSEPVIIRTPIPTPEETADRLGVPRSRIKWLRSILIEQGSLPASAKKSLSKKSTTAAQKPKSVAKSRNGKASR